VHRYAGVLRLLDEGLLVEAMNLHGDFGGIKEKSKGKQKGKEKNQPDEEDGAKSNKKDEPEDEEEKVEEDELTAEGFIKRVGLFPLHNHLVCQFLLQFCATKMAMLLRLCGKRRMEPNFLWKLKRQFTYMITEGESLRTSSGRFRPANVKIAKGFNISSSSSFSFWAFLESFTPELPQIFFRIPSGLRKDGNVKIFKQVLSKKSGATMKAMNMEEKNIFEALEEEPKVIDQSKIAKTRKLTKRDVVLGEKASR